MLNKYRAFLILIMFPLWITSLSQEVIIDEVVAVVGSNPILYSDIEGQYLQYKMQGNIRGGDAARCFILENLLFQNLLLHQAEIDSIVVPDSRVETTMNQRLRFYISQFGSQEKLEEFYGKSVLEIKEEMRELVRDQLKVEDVQMNITSNLKITPSEVREYYSSLPNDSIPLVNTEYVIGQIVKLPPVSIEELTKSLEKIRELRRRILEGENFKTLAILYSEDPGSASKGGELGFFSRGTMYPEFESAAFNLKNIGDISEVVKTEAGYHIIQLVDKEGDYINCRHILVMPKVSSEDLMKAKNELDSIANLIQNDSISFDEAALMFSDDPGKISGGLLINPMTNTIRFEADQLDPNLFFVIDKLEPGEISQPVQFITEEGKQAYRILYLKERTSPHRANLKDDYSKMQELAMQNKKNSVISKWVKTKLEKTYISISERYRDCDFEHNWFKK